MAKVTITIEDTDDGVDADVEFDPVKEANAELTPAQHAAVKMLDAVFTASHITSIE